MIIKYESWLTKFFFWSLEPKHNGNVYLKHWYLFVFFLKNLNSYFSYLHLSRKWFHTEKILRGNKKTPQMKLFEHITEFLLLMMSLDSVISLYVRRRPLTSGRGLGRQWRETNSARLRCVISSHNLICPKPRKKVLSQRSSLLMRLHWTYPRLHH